MTVRGDLPPGLLTMFDDPELLEISNQKPKRGEGKPDALELARAWEVHVEKIDDDRALSGDDHSVWTEYDLAAALFVRDFVADALSCLRPELAEKVRRYVVTVDDRFRSFTVPDTGERMAKVAQVDVAGRGWWWFRVPDSGPIVQDLTMYS